MYTAIVDHEYLIKSIRFIVHVSLIFYRRITHVKALTKMSRVLDELCNCVMGFQYCG